MALSTVGLVVSVGSFLLAVWAIWLASKSTRQLLSVQRLAEEARGTLTTLGRDLADFDSRQSVQLDRLEEATGSIPELTAGEDETAAKQRRPALDEAAGEEYARMRPLEVSELPSDVAMAVEEQADADLVWALQRRGSGRARWLVGTDQGGPWRVTRREGEAFVEQSTGIADPVEPVRLSELEPEAVAALADASGVDSSKFEEVVYRRRTRGVPVYYTFINENGSGRQPWRLVKTRWGWGASPEGN